MALCTLLMLLLLSMTPNELYAQAISDEDVLVTEIGSFEYGDKSNSIWASLRNEDTSRKSSEWQFRYKPLFLPVVDDQGALDVNVRADVSSNSAIVEFRILLDSSEVRRRAFERVKQINRDKASELVDGCAKAMPLQHLEVKLPDLTRRFPAARLEKSEWNSPEEIVRIAIEAGSEEDARRIEASISYWTVEYVLTTSTRQVQRSSAKVSTDIIADSGLQVELDGLSKGGKCYVHREDLRKLASKYAEKIRVLLYSEGQEVRSHEEFARRFVDAFVQYWPTSKPYTAFDEAMRESTYQSSDLAPTRVTHTLNKLFRKQQGRDEFMLNTETAASAEGGFLGIGAKAAGKLNFTLEEMHEFLEEMNVEAEWTGEKWEAKEVYVQEVNTAELKGDKSALFVDNVVLEAKAKDIPGDLDLSTKLIGVDLTLAGRLANLERHIRVSDKQVEIRDTSKVIFRAPVEFDDTTKFSDRHVLHLGKATNIEVMVNYEAPENMVTEAKEEVVTFNSVANQFPKWIHGRPTPADGNERGWYLNELQRRFYPSGKWAHHGWWLAPASPNQQDGNETTNNFQKIHFFNFGGQGEARH